MRRYTATIKCYCGMVHTGKSFISQPMADKAAKQNAEIYHRYRHICGDSVAAEATHTYPAETAS